MLLSSDSTVRATRVQDQVQTCDMSRDDQRAVDRSQHASADHNTNQNWGTSTKHPQHFKMSFTRSQNIKAKFWAQLMALVSSIWQWILSNCCQSISADTRKCLNVTAFDKIQVTFIVNRQCRHFLQEENSFAWFEIWNNSSGVECNECKTPHSAWLWLNSYQWQLSECLPSRSVKVLSKLWTNVNRMFVQH